MTGYTGELRLVTLPTVQLEQVRIAMQGIGELLLEGTAEQHSPSGQWQQSLDQESLPFAAAATMSRHTGWVDVKATFPKARGEARVDLQQRGGLGGESTLAVRRRGSIGFLTTLRAPSIIVADVVRIRQLIQEGQGHR